MKTFIAKDHYGNWQSVSQEDLNERLTLQIKTHKTHNGNLNTTASVYHDAGNGMISHAYGTDFNKMLVSKQYGRVTSKVVEQQHSTVDFEQIKAEAIAFYDRASV